MSQSTVVRKEKVKFQQKSNERSKTSPLIKPRADRAVVSVPPQVNRSYAKRRDLQESAATSPAFTKDRMRQEHAPPPAPKKKSCGQGSEGQPRKNVGHVKRRRTIEKEWEEKVTIDLRGSEGVEAVESEKRDVSRDAAVKDHRTDSEEYNETEDGEEGNTGTLNEEQSYGEDESNEEEDSHNGYNNTEDDDDEDDDDEEPSQSSRREERRSEDNRKKTYRKTQGGTSDKGREESNADKELVLKEKAIEGRK
ncbi:hypothetical protein CBR_g37744 [Chara braunii]|uniref:Uncharacterized protein n=1 Tax=Chara braunii TaxID=69332 RepID=A0A388LNK1_CHABU|nr:hypothetical protein CBR_g37744 [Chara braunii]|eukprot:GBG83874.1 hypothetical protein CBR_g37744 [Chara braunii]